MRTDLSAPILLVDDFQNMLNVLKAMLLDLGFSRVDLANSGAQALEMLAREHYALVISDCHMQPMSGFELLQRMRESPESANTAFIMMTAESKTDTHLAARKAGADGYIVKPFSAAALKAKINAAVTAI